MVDHSAITASQVIGGGISSITAGTGLSGGTITTSGTISLSTSGVTAGTYGDATNTAQIVVNSQGQITSATNISISAGIVRVVNRVLVSSGTYIPSSGMQYCEIELVAAGGGGGGVVIGGAGGGGGAGGYYRTLHTSTDIGTGVTVTIGAGGLAGTSGGGDGGNGGSSSFGTFATCNGGTGGQGWDSGSSAPNRTLGGAGGVVVVGAPGTGDIKIYGQYGQTGFVTSGSVVIGGHGGACPLGFFAGFGATIGGYGAGGYGIQSTGGLPEAGVDGLNGVLFIREYCA